MKLIRFGGHLTIAQRRCPPNRLNFTTSFARTSVLRSASLRRASQRSLPPRHDAIARPGQRPLRSLPRTHGPRLRGNWFVVFRQMAEAGTRHACQKGLFNSARLNPMSARRRSSSLDSSRRVQARECQDRTIMSALAIAPLSAVPGIGESTTGRVDSVCVDVFHLDFSRSGCVPFRPGDAAVLRWRRVRSWHPARGSSPRHAERAEDHHRAEQG